MHNTQYPKNCNIDAHTRTTSKRSFGDSDEDENDDEELETLQIRKRCKYFYPIALEAWHDTYEQFENRMTTQNSDNENAEDIVFTEMEDKHVKAFFQVYKDFLTKSLCTRKSWLHQQVLENAIQLHKMDVQAKDAVKISVRKYRDDFDAATFVRHAGTEDDSEEETDEEDTLSESSGGRDDDLDTEDSHSGSEENEGKEVFETPPSENRSNNSGDTSEDSMTYADSESSHSGSNED